MAPNELRNTVINTLIGGAAGYVVFSFLNPLVVRTISHLVEDNANAQAILFLAYIVLYLLVPLILLFLIIIYFDLKTTRVLQYKSRKIFQSHIIIGVAIIALLMLIIFVPLVAWEKTNCAFEKLDNYKKSKNSLHEKTETVALINFLNDNFYAQDVFTVSDSCIFLATHSNFKIADTIRNIISTTNNLTDSVFRKKLADAKDTIKQVTLIGKGKTNKKDYDNLIGINKRMNETELALWSYYKDVKYNNAANEFAGVFKSVKRISAGTLICLILVLVALLYVQLKKINTTPDSKPYISLLSSVLLVYALMFAQLVPTIKTANINLDEEDFQYKFDSWYAPSALLGHRSEQKQSKFLYKSIPNLITPELPVKSNNNGDQPGKDSTKNGTYELNKDTVKNLVLSLKAQIKTVDELILKYPDREIEIRQLNEILKELHEYLSNENDKLKKQTKRIDTLRSDVTRLKDYNSKMYGKQ